MIGLNRFIQDVCHVIGRDITSNCEQFDIVASDFRRCLKVVAGPGSGKTTVIVLRLLKMIFVDNVPPEKIIATTFTRKAASELKSRILKWGLILQRHYAEDATLPKEISDRIRRLNFDLITTGTLDSIAEDVLTRYRKPDENPPIVISDFVGRQILLDQVFEIDRTRETVKRELHDIGLKHYDYINMPKIVNRLMEIHSRAAENHIEPESLSDQMPTISRILVRYRDTLADRQFLDFSGLEARFIHKIEDGGLDEFLSGISVLMVDEYQDTNIQQETIYKALASRIIPAGGSMMVVGDDDQSIFRFRGSRVHLFANLESRFTDTGTTFETAFLSVNYRSTPNIVNFCNRLLSVDGDYQEVRVTSKPSMSVGRSDGINVPVLGIFRSSADELARDIACLVSDYAEKGLYTFECIDGTQYTFEKNQKGSAADIVLLMGSTKNVTANDRGDRPNLPLLISNHLDGMGSNIRVFNPRGNELFNDPNIMTLCGVVLECIDPNEAVASNIRLNRNQSLLIRRWRERAHQYIESAPDFKGHSLRTLVDSWKEGRPYPAGGKWGKKDVNLIDLMSNIITWMPEFQNDAESLVYYQALCDAVSTSVLIKGYEFKLEFKKGSTKPSEQSVKAIYNKILLPIADGTMEIDEELFFSVSLKDRLSIMTVHQSKGLEFPITIVDVSSELQKDTGKNRRYPDSLDITSIIESVIRAHSGGVPSERNLLDSQFDDIIRKFFVAYSRAQDVLIIVGTSRTISRDKPLKHMALGWDRHDNWHWRGLPDIKMMR